MPFKKKNYICSFPFFYLLTVILALYVPLLALFISLFGALCLSVLGIAFPAVMEICVLYPDQLGKCYNVILRNIVLIAIGLFAGITGTHKSLVDIYVAITTPDPYYGYCHFTNGTFANTTNIICTSVNGVLNNSTELNLPTSTVANSL